MKVIQYTSPYDGKVYIQFKCPGCGDTHCINIEKSHKPCWDFNGDLDKPTLSPSILSRSGHYVDGDKTKCWCAYYAENPDKKPQEGFECHICHSFVRDGKIEFLSDCTHKLAGQTVDLIDID